MKFTLSRKLAILFMATFIHTNVQAQSEVEELFKANAADAGKLIGAYLMPLQKGIGTGLNAGWSHTAKAKGALNFELRISLAGAMVPQKEQSYDVNALNLSNIRPVNANNSTGPTAFGADEEGAEMEIMASNVSVGKFRLPQGLGFNIVPTPQIQATLGVHKYVDLMARYVPSVEITEDGGKLDMFGAGVKITPLPLILGEKANKLPFDVATSFGFSKIKFDLPIDVNSGKYSNQMVQSEFNGFHLEAMISKKLAILTPFAAIGYQSSSSELKAIGTYEFDNGITSNTQTDPINLKQSDFSGLRASVGFQLKLAFLKIFGSYTAFGYNTVNAGIAFSSGN